MSPRSGSAIREPMRLNLAQHAERRSPGEPVSERPHPGVILNESADEVSLKINNTALVVEEDRHGPLAEMMVRRPDLQAHWVL